MSQPDSELSSSPADRGARDSLPSLWKWVLQFAAAAGITGMFCCVAPAVLFLLGLMGGVYAISFANFFYRPDGSPGLGGWVLRGLAVLIGLAGVLLYGRRQNQCSIDPHRKRLNLALASIAILLIGTGLFLTLEKATSWYFAKRIVPAQQAELGYRTPVKPEEPQGYPDDPSAIAPPLRQDLTQVQLKRRADGVFDVKLGPTATAPVLENVDIRPLLPRIPELARGDKTLMKIAAMQREFNRNQTNYGQSAGAEDFRVANNCLRSGLWEVMLNRKQDGKDHKVYHGWFTFPECEIAGQFEKMTGVEYAEFAELLKEPRLEGFIVPLERLRTILTESPAAPLVSHLDEPVARLPEQQRKAKLIVTSGIQTYRDWTDPKKQPIAVAQFVDPGQYSTARPVYFDLAWLAEPEGLIRRDVRSVQGGRSLREIELRFRNGHRLLLADESLAGLSARSEPPEAEQDLLRITFGIETPEIYASKEERQREFTHPRANYLFMLDSQNGHLDNHQRGLDRVYLWLQAGDAGNPGTLHLYLIGYERIAIVSHLSTPWVPAAAMPPNASS